MPSRTSHTESDHTESDGFSAEERAAMKERAAELRAEGKKGAKKADGLQAVLDSIAAMAPEDRALAERVHVTVTATAARLATRTAPPQPSPPGATPAVRSAASRDRPPDPVRQPTSAHRLRAARAARRRRTRRMMRLASRPSAVRGRCGRCEPQP